MPKMNHKGLNVLSNLQLMLKMRVAAACLLVNVLRVNLKVVCNEMEGGWDTCLFNPYWYGTHVIVVGLNFNGDVVF